MGVKPSLGAGHFPQCPAPDGNLPGTAEWHALCVPGTFRVPGDMPTAMAGKTPDDLLLAAAPCRLEDPR